MCLLCGYSEQDIHGLSSHTQQILKPEKQAVALQSITDTENQVLRQRRVGSIHFK